MKNLFLGLAAIILTAPVALANDGGCSTCGGGGVASAPAPRTWGPKAHKYERFTGWFHGTSNAAKPAIAPWYLYYPYNGMYQTPGPVAGMNPYGGGMVNPYFPGQ